MWFAKFLIFVVIVLTSFYLLRSIEMAWSQLSDTPIISTRNHYDILSGKTVLSNSTYNVIDKSGLISTCPSEIVIYIHGVWVGIDSLEQPEEVFDRLNMSLSHKNNITLVGYSWDSDTSISPQGWNIAKQIAVKNGENLGNFISYYKKECANSEVRVIAHSLGARVIFEALEHLNNNTMWNNNMFKILSVDLVGAAVDNEEISTNPNDGKDDDFSPRSPVYDPTVKSIYGNLIESQVQDLNNWYNTEDDVLEPESECRYFICQPVYYPFYEGDLALGQNGSQLGIPLPRNYNQTNVEGEIYFEDDANGNRKCDLVIPFTPYCSINRTGDNHFGYIGFRDGDNQSRLIDSEAIHLITKDWT